MPSRGHLVQVAKDLKKRLNGKAFLTMERVEITELIRTISGEETTRLKRNMSAELEHVMLEQGVRCYPSLEETTTGDSVRLFHPNTVIANVVDILRDPSDYSDKQLADITLKVKGMWNWPVQPS